VYVVRRGSHKRKAQISLGQVRSLTSLFRKGHPTVRVGGPIFP
jgi:hypothetical protein